MFHLFKKDIVLYAPVKGKCVLLEEVPDAMFAQKMMGDGVAFVYEGNIIHAPCDGEILMIAQTKHALGIKTAKNVEIMLHIGLDSVNLNGKGFTTFVHVGEKIKKGQKLIQLDREFLENSGVNMITPMIITSKHKVEIKKIGEVDQNTEVLKVL